MTHSSKEKLKEENERMKEENEKAKYNRSFPLFSVRIISDEELVSFPDERHASQMRAALFHPS